MEKISLKVTEISIFITPSMSHISARKRLSAGQLALIARLRSHLERLDPGLDCRHYYFVSYSRCYCTASYVVKLIANKYEAKLVREHVILALLHLYEVHITFNAAHVVLG